MLCAARKLSTAWKRLENTKALIKELSVDVGQPTSQLIDSKKGGNNFNSQGSWI